MLRASLALSKRLRAHGHEMIYSTPFDNRTEVENQGIEYAPLPPIPFSYQSGQSWEEIFNSWPLKAFEAFLEKHDIDLVIIDMELHELILHAHHIGQPFVLINQWFPVWKSQGIPHLKSLAQPGKGLQGSTIGTEFLWFIFKIQRRFKNLLNQFRYKGRDRRSALLEYARMTGFPMKALDPHGWPPPLTYRGLPIMCLNNEALDFPENQRPLDTFAGSQIDEDRWEPVVDEDLQRIDRIFESASEGAKVICCTLSTMDPTNTVHLNNVIEAVRRHPEWKLLITLGQKSSITDTMALPDNIHVFNWLPQLRVLEKADVSINHGGIHTINECVHYGVPMLIYSGGRHDQNGCAARVGYHGVGIVGDKKSDRAEDVEHFLHDLMTNRSYSESLEALRQKDKEYRTYRAAENYIDRMLKQHKA